MTDKVLDFNKKRTENIEKKRRSFERIVFQNFLGAHYAVEQEGTLYPVNLVDISRTGCLFQVPWNPKKDTKIKNSDEIKLRFYFTKNSFIPVFVNVVYGNEYVDTDGQTYMRYGCEFNQTYPTFEAVKPFIDFLYKYSEMSSIDKGDAKAFFF